MHKLRRELEAYIREWDTAEADKPEPHLGDNWFHLSKSEEEVFEIRRSRFMRMVMTHHCYECFKDITHNPAFTDAALAEARVAKPEWIGTRPIVDEFTDFADEVGNVTNREAHAIFYKMEFWTVRLGVMEYADEGVP